MLILLTNDDGVGAPGLEALRQALDSIGDVWVVAPNGERSTSSQTLTLREPVAVKRVGPREFAVDGWPADCTYLGLFGLLPQRPDIVVSGINLGPNLGTDVLYSGTVGAAREAYSRGVSAIAVSLVVGHDFGLAARFTRSLVEELERGSESLLLNVNVPSGEAKGARIARLGRRIYPENIELVEERGDLASYRLASKGRPRDALIPGSDGEVIEQGMISVTPLGLDSTLGEVMSSVSAISGSAWKHIS